MIQISRMCTRGVCLLLLAAGSAATASQASVSADGIRFSPYAGSAAPSTVYWGDTHVHTNLSADGNLAGNLDMGPEQAYRFARGEEVRSQHGRPAKLGRPLDFVVLSDHAEGLGLLPLLRAGDTRLLASPTWRKIYEGLSSDDAKEIQRAAWDLGSALMERGQDLFEDDPELAAR